MLICRQANKSIGKTRNRWEVVPWWRSYLTREQLSINCASASPTGPSHKQHLNAAEFVGSAVIPWMKFSAISVWWPEQFCSVLVKSGCLNNLSALSGPRFVLVSSVASTISVSFLVFSGIVSLVGSTISLQQAFGMLMSNDFVMDVINWWLSLTTSWWSQRFRFVSVVVSSLVLALSLSAWLSHLGARSNSRFIVVRFIKHCEFSLTFVIWLFWQYWCRGIVSQQLYFLPIPHKQVNKKMPSQIGKLRELGRKGTRLWIIHELKFENLGVKINPQYNMAELINLFETPHWRKVILDTLVTTTNGDLDAACNLEGHILNIVAVRFLYESIKRIV